MRNVFVSALAAMSLIGCGTESAPNAQNGSTKEESSKQFASDEAARPAEMPKMVVVKVREDGRGDVLSGASNVEVRTLNSDVASLNESNISTAFSSQGQAAVVLDNSDSLDGDSSQGQHYWRGYWGWGRGRAAWGWGHYGYSNWYRPSYYYWGNSFNYGYNNWYSWGGYRYYCYWY
jgi:hypothetical protein